MKTPLILACLSSLASTAFAYEVETHKELSLRAVEASELRGRLTEIGLADLDAELPSPTKPLPDAQLIGTPSNVGVLTPQRALSGNNNPF